jgi:prepilin-type N-terminal cleavage/methylation domain-containing protein
MKSRQTSTLRSTGYSLIEVMLVVALLGACVGAGAVSWCSNSARAEARGCAHAWQAAATVGQVEVRWRGGRSEASAGAHGVALAHDPNGSGLALEGRAPVCVVETNVGRWRTPDGAEVAFGGLVASPDSGGSVYFGAGEGSYRVTIRPETGLTIRRWVER